MNHLKPFRTGLFFVVFLSVLSWSDTFFTQKNSVELNCASILYLHQGIDDHFEIEVKPGINCYIFDHGYIGMSMSLGKGSYDFLIMEKRELPSWKYSNYTENSYENFFYTAGFHAGFAYGKRNKIIPFFETGFYININTIDDFTVSKPSSPFICDDIMNPDHPTKYVTHHEGYRECTFSSPIEAGVKVPLGNKYALAASMLHTFRFGDLPVFYQMPELRSNVKFSVEFSAMFK